MHKPFNARRQLAPLVSCLALFIFSPLAWAQLSGGSIVGQVRVTPGTELPSPVLISLESRGTVINTVYTDGEGRFGFNGLPGNIYHIKIDDEAYFPASETVIIDPETTSVRMVNIFLNPRNPAKAGFTRGDWRQSSSDQLSGPEKAVSPAGDQGIRRRSQSGRTSQAG